MLRARAALFGGLWLIAACSASQPVPSVTSQTVCQLYAARLAPPRQPVRLHATAWVALRHGGALLRDSTCPKVVIGFRLADDARDRPRIKQFSEAMTGDVMDLKPRLFDVQLIGVYTGPTTAERNGLFLVQDVEHFAQHP